MDRTFGLTTEDAVARVRAVEPRARAFVTTRLDDALRDAQLRRQETPRSPLHGVPYGLKDEWETVDLPTTAGSYRHRNRRPRANSPVFDTFRDAGAVLIGKSSLSDLGLPPEASNFIRGSTRNPVDPRRTAGGSSGGSAAAVALGMAAFDWGTDIGGSIRLPAGFCQVLGLRLSSETWPIEGLFPRLPESLGWMCGQGPFTRTTREMRVVLKVAAPRLRRGHGAGFVPRGAVLHCPDRGCWPTFASDVAPHARAAVGGELVVNAGLPPPAALRDRYVAVWASHFEDCLDADDTLSFREGLAATLSAVLFRGVFGDRRIHPPTAELLLLMMFGRAFLFRDRHRARAEAFEVRDAFRRIWDQGCVVIAPVAAYPPPFVLRTNFHPHILSCVVAGNLADATGLAIPFGGFGPLPRAVQLMGPPGSEEALLDVADRWIESTERDPSLRPRPQSPVWDGASSLGVPGA